MNILIVGASSGIGEEIAKYNDIPINTMFLVGKSELKLQKVSQKIRKAKVYIFPFDLQDIGNIKDIYEFIGDKNVKLDSMIFTAGVSRELPIRVNNVQLMKEVFEVNVMSFVELGKYMLKKKYSNDSAAIVAISSMAAYKPNSAMCTYNASKAALNAAVKVMAKEGLQRKIRANAILPAFVDTPMMKASEEKIGSLDIAQPLGIIEPIHIAYMVDYLLSDKAKYITAAEIQINAGAI